MMKKAPLTKRSSPRTASKVSEVLKIIGEESRRNGTDTLTSRHIDATIKACRAQKKKR